MKTIPPLSAVAPAIPSSPTLQISGGRADDLMRVCAQRSARPFGQVPAQGTILARKRRFAFFPILGLLAAGGAHAETFKAAFDEIHPFDAHGEIRLANVNGSVSIRTWDRAEVRIEGEKRALSADDLRATKVSIDATANTLDIETRYPLHLFSWFHWFGPRREEEVHFTLTVPATARIGKLDTVNASITIDGVRGAITARTVNGGIRATGLEENASLETVNGSIRAEFAALNPQGHLKINTVNGSITVALPKSAGATIAASTVNGRISCDFPLLLKNSGRNNLTGTIGDGVATLKATSVNGGIHLESL
jgi:hypothetical protein